MQNHEDHSPRASQLIVDISAGRQFGAMSETVVFETIFTVTKYYRVPRAAVKTAMERILQLENLSCPHKPLLHETLSLWVRETPLSFADCYHLVLTKALGLTEIYTFDKKMGRYPGVTRIEP